MGTTRLTISVGSLLELLRPYLGDPVGRLMATDSGTEQRFHCPWDPPGKRAAFGINLETGLSFCHRCHKGWSIGTLLRDLQAPRSTRQVAMGLVSPPTVYDKLRANAPENPILPESLLGVFEPTNPMRYFGLTRWGFSLGTLRRYDVGWDLTRGRFTYPLRDWQGHLIGVVGGDGTGWQEPKYKVYGKEELQTLLPDTSVGAAAIRKQFLLWNLHDVWPSAYGGAEDPIIVVEGFKAALWVLQASYRHVVALMGSYMSTWQAMALLHFSNTKVLFLDNDDAGKRGTREAQRLIVRLGGRPFKEAIYPPNPNVHQPDGLTAEDLEHAIGGTEWSGLD